MKLARNVATSVLAAALVGMSSFAQVAYGADLIKNGSFEQNSQASGSWSIYSSLIGWTGSPNIELRNNVAGTAYDGVNFVELDTYANSSMTQTLTGAAGVYQLSFWYSARPGTDATNDLSFTIDGSAPVTLLQGVSNSGNNHNWQQYTALVNFDGSGDITFSAVGRSDALGGSLDKVSFTAAVPEPETYAMMMVGLGLIGGIARHRKQQQATA
jgi:hypothetical protein